MSRNAGLRVWVPNTHPVPASCRSAEEFRMPEANGPACGRIPHSGKPFAPGPIRLPGSWPLPSRIERGSALAQRRFQISLDTTGSGSNADVIQPPPAHETFYSVQNTLTIPLPVGARPRLAVKQAQAELEAARAQYDSARLTLAQDVSTAYYDLLRRQALLQIAQENLATAQRQLEETQRRLTAGDVAPLDVTRAQVPVATAQAG